MKSTQRTIFAYLVVLLSVLVAVSAVMWANYRFVILNPGGNDFLARWMGAKMWLMEGISPYDASVSLETQRLVYGHPANPEEGEDLNHFVYPLYSMIFFAPFGLIDYTLARTLWMTLVEISLIALVFVSLKITSWRVPIWKAGLLVLFSLLWYHGARTIILGQFAGINSLLIVLALLFVQQKQDIAAGLLLALSTIKPQMTFLLVPFVLMWGVSIKRYTLVLSMLVGFMGLMVISLVMIPYWPLEMLDQVIEYPTYTPVSSPLSIIADLVPGIKVEVYGFLNIIFGLYLFVEWVLAWGKGDHWFLWTALITLVITHIMVLRSGTTQFTVFMPALFLIFRAFEERWELWGRVGLWVLMLVLLIGIWGLFLNTLQGNQESSILYIPLPFLCLIGLWWIRGGVIYRSRMLQGSLS